MPASQDSTVNFLFGASGLTPHGFCLAWQPGLIWLTAGANLVIAAAYFCIPLALVVLLLRWRNAPYKPVFGLFAGFIVACGLSHLLTALTLWVPLYWLSGVVDSITAVLSVLTAIVVWPAIAKIVYADQELQSARSLAEAGRLRLEELAMQDSLTGLANRRHFDTFLDTEVRRAKRAGTPVALIMIDADKFKPFNDMYGHPSGDACLRLVATAIRGQLRRAGDLAARFGGDEFAAVLPGADETGAAIVAERIVHAIRRLGILHPANASGIFTASAGVAAIMPSLSAFEPHHLLQLADAALYAAKDTGGNRVSSIEQAAHYRDTIFHRTPDDQPLPEDAPESDWTPRMPAGIDFAGILRGIPFGVLVTDSTQPDHPIVFANAGFAKMTGYTLRETVGRNSRFLQGAETDASTIEEVAEAIRHGLPIQREVLNYRKDGTAFWNELFVQPLTDRHGAVVGFVGLQIDQSARYRAEEAQRDSEAKLAAIVANLPGYIFQRTITKNGVLVYSYFSQTYWRLLGIDQVPQLPDYDPYLNIHPADAERVRSAVARSSQNMSTCTVEFRAIRATGESLWLRTQSSPRALAGGNIAWDGVGIDITAEMAARESLTYLAYHNPLTGLCNRVLFLKTLDEMRAPRPDLPRQVATFAQQGVRDATEAMKDAATLLNIQVIDVSEGPKRAIADGIPVTPTLIAQYAGKRVMMMGDLSDAAALRSVLDACAHALEEADAPQGEPV